mmetsp:Transcript_12071/g.20511  ORF Transcript_12071/g.20511 Transcript_12071/m.20511 type:complete len:96 (-) Transcript_12071:512-799(-)
MTQLRGVVRGRPLQLSNGQRNQVKAFLPFVKQESIERAYYQDEDRKAPRPDSTSFCCASIRPSEGGFMPRTRRLPVNDEITPCPSQSQWLNYCYF